MSRKLIGISVVVIFCLVSGCGYSELDEAENSLEKLTRELQLKTQKLKVLEEKIDNPKLDNLQESMRRLKTQWEQEIEELRAKIEATEERIAELRGGD